MMVKQNKTVPNQTKSKHPIKDLLIPKESKKKLIKVRVFSKIMKSNKREPRSKVSPLFRLESFPMSGGRLIGSFWLKQNVFEQRC